jgi:hypothetical protein
VQLASSVTFGHAIQHSFVSAEGQMNASMTCQPLKYIRGMNAFVSPVLQIGGGKKNTHGCLVII